jgi:hypothetical protein
MAEEIPTWREAWANTDIHRSWRMYAQRGNLYGYCKPVLAFEIGDNVDIKTAQKMALRLIDKFYDIFGVERDSWSIIYSGKRSFHLWQEQALFNVKPMPSHLVALAMKELARRLARAHKVDIDPKIYTATGTLRLPNSRHPKTKLFAVPITYPELKMLPIEQIQALAIEARVIPTGEGGPSRELTDLFRDIVQTVQNQEAFFELEGRHASQVLPDEATPECIKAVAAGINEGERHWAAIALASWLHRMRKLAPSEVELEVKQWNKEKNHPPMEPSEVEAIIKDVLNDKVRGSCSNESQAKRCVHDKCWIYVGKTPPGAKGKEGKKKPDIDRDKLPTRINDKLWKSLVEEFTVGKDEETERPTIIAKPFYYFADGCVAREVLNEGFPRFALYNPETDEIVIVDMVEGELGEVVVPVWDGFVGPRLGITLPEKPEDYGDATSLFKQLLAFVLKYYDPVDAEGLAQVKLCILYCMLTGFQDQNIDYWPIVNHRGASETGKGRLAFLMYLICDRGMWQVHPSIGTLHRDVNLWRPTLVIDEADMKETDASNEMIQFYNARATGAVFSRYNTDTKGSQISEVTGPTVLCTRQGFKDDGMESRSLIITGKQGRNMGRNKDGKEGVPYAMPPKAFEEARKLRNKLLTFWFKNHDKYEVDYYGSFDGPITPRFQTTTLELMGMAEKIGLKDIVLATTTEMSRRVVDQRSETTEGRIVRALHSLWTDPAVGHKTTSESSKYLSAEGYFGLVALKKSENGREENVTEEDVSAKELAEVGHKSFGLHAYKETDKPMAASAIGKHLANLGIKTDQKKFGGHVRHLILLKAADLEYLCRKFVPGYEMGEVFDGSAVSSVLDDFDKKRECVSDGVSSPQSNYSPEKVAGEAGVADGIGRVTPLISGPDDSTGTDDNDEISRETPLRPATPATENESARGDTKGGGVTPPIRPATVATPATATPATEGKKHSNATERQTPPLSEFKLPKEIVLAYRRVPVQEDLKDWAVTRKHFAMVNGDPYGPHKARKDAPDAYPALPQEIASLCDFNWHDIERVAGYLHDHKVDVAAALEIMHKPKEVPR